MSLFSTSLVGNPYLNHVLAGAVEIPAYLFAPQLMNRIGRKKTVIASHFFTTLSLLPLTFIKMGKFLAFSFDVVTRIHFRKQVFVRQFLASGKARDFNFVFVLVCIR